MSSLRRCPYFRGSFIHILDGKVCSVLIKEVSLFQVLYTSLCNWDGKVCSVLIKEVSLFQG